MTVDVPTVSIRDYYDALYHLSAIRKYFEDKQGEIADDITNYIKTDFITNYYAIHGKDFERKTDFLREEEEHIRAAVNESVRECKEKILGKLSRKYAEYRLQPRTKIEMPANFRIEK